MYLSSLHTVVELSFFLRPTVSRAVRLSIGLPFGAHDKIFILILSLVKIALLFFL
jgi:hypothetical protein